MAARIFPNTVFVKEFPSSMSSRDFLSIFGGCKGHIKAVDFANTNGEPKAAFIEYEHADSLPLALEMNGTHLFNHPYALNVQVVDERVLCEHVPGEMYHVNEALNNLQQVLFSVLATRDQALSTYRTNINNLTQINQQSLAMINDLRKNYEQLMVQKNGEERDTNSNLLQTIAQLDTATDRCAKLEAGKGVLEERLKDAVESERESTSKLMLVSTQLESVTGRCWQLQREIDALRTRLTEVDSEHKVEQGRIASEAKETEGLRRELDETTARKERAMESLGLANNTVLRLQEELKLTQKTAEVSHSSLRSAKSSLQDMVIRVRALQTHVTQTQTKRQRAEEDLMDERDAKRRLIEERDTVETRCRARAYEAEKCEAERQQLEERLRMETHLRKQTEESLAEANAKLDRVVVTDLLTAAFVKLDQLVMQVVEDASLPDDSSTSR